MMVRYWLSMIDRSDLEARRAWNTTGQHLRLGP